MQVKSDIPHHNVSIPNPRILQASVGVVNQSITTLLAAANFPPGATQEAAIGYALPMGNRNAAVMSRIRLKVDF